MTSESLHESADALSGTTIDRHRAVASLREELDAIDWYDQRVEATSDAELARLLAHNRDDEKEHAAMLIEWLRRRDPGFAHELATYLFAAGDVVELERDKDEGHCAPSDGSLGIGSLRRGS